MTRILIIDNHDSFVYNIAQYLGELGSEVQVLRDDSPSLDPHIPGSDGYVISPGPGHPKDLKRSLEVLANNGFGKPVLGVCLGHQAIAMVNGGLVIRSGHPVHGKVSSVWHNGDSLFEGIPSPFNATRYHSLVVSREHLPSSVSVLASTEGGEIMAIKLKDNDIYGVQFHPESVMTSYGRTILSNFIRKCRR